MLPCEESNRAAHRSAQPMPRRVKRNGSLAEVRGIEQGGAPLCLARGRFPPPVNITSRLRPGVFRIKQRELIIMRRKGRFDNLKGRGKTPPFY